MQREKWPNYEHVLSEIPGILPFLFSSMLSPVTEVCSGAAPAFGFSKHFLDIVSFYSLQDLTLFFSVFERNVPQSGSVTLWRLQWVGSLPSWVESWAYSLGFCFLIYEMGVIVLTSWGCWGESQGFMCEKVECLVLRVWSVERQQQRTGPRPDLSNHKLWVWDAVICI